MNNEGSRYTTWADDNRVGCGSPIGRSQSRRVSSDFYFRFGRTTRLIRESVVSARKKKDYYSNFDGGEKKNRREFLWYVPVNWFRHFRESFTR